MTPFEKMLRKSGPLTSSELATRLAKAEGIPVNTVSQRISRTQAIQQLKGFLRSRQSICYLQEHATKGELLDAVSLIMRDYGRKYWYTLNAVKLHGGTISRKYLESYTNYPILPLRGHVPFEKVMQRFVSEGILVFSGDNYHFSPQFTRLIPNELARKTIELIKDKTIDDFHSLIRNTGLISYHSGKPFSEFGKFQWAMTGPSYVHGVQATGKPGFLVADIILGRPFFKDDVLFFVDKLKHIESFKSARRLLPFLLVDDLDAEALQHLKAHGVIVGFIGELFGQRYAAALRELFTVLNNAGASLKSNPDKYLDLIQELKKYNEGLANNIRGTLFEFVVAHIHREQCQSIDLGREIIANSSRHDMDVMATYADKVLVAECKATKALVDEDMVEQWLTNKIPAFRQWIQSQEILNKKEIQFEYWSISGFTDGAETLLREASASSKKYTVSYFDGTDARKHAIRMKNKKLKEALDNFFLKPEV